MKLTQQMRLRVKGQSIRSTILKETVHEQNSSGGGSHQVRKIGNHHKNDNGEVSWVLIKTGSSSLFHINWEVGSESFPLFSQRERVEESKKVSVLNPMSATSKDPLSSTR